MSNPYNDQHYTTICSERTLQTNANGFFMNFVKLICDKAGEKWINDKFKQIQTDRERIRIIYNNERIKDPVISVLSNVEEIFRRKSAQIAQLKRLEADKYYQLKDYKTSLTVYSQSILRSPKTDLDRNYDDGKSLSLAFWGRAQVLLQLEEYSHALNDIQLALKERLPNASKPEAYWKMAICYKALDDVDKASVAFALAEKLFTDKDKLSLLQKDRLSVFNPREKEREKVLPEVDGPTIKNDHTVSDKIGIVKNGGMGRYAIANKEIKTGETLVVEEPYAACLLPDMFGTHCHHCFDRLVAPVGCHDCSNVAFCRPACRDAALLSYHKYECKFTELLIGSGMSILSHIALRMITQNSLSRCLEIYHDRSKENVYSLCTNAEKRSGADFLQRTLMAAFLLRCLQKSGYFGNRKGDYVIPTEEEYQIGELLLFHLQVLQFNAHEILETRKSSEHIFKGSRTHYIGVAIYPTVALFNHGCYPGVTRHFVGKHIVIKASRPLKPNEMIAENYGPTFTRKSLPDRQRSLSSRYWFDCHCNACQNKWPMIGAGLEDVNRKVKCPTDSCSYYFTVTLSDGTLNCPICQENVNLSDQIRMLKWCENQYEFGLKLMNEQQPEQAIQILCEAIDTFHRVSSPPHKATHLAQERLQICVATFGNVSNTLVRTTPKEHCKS